MRYSVVDLGRDVVPWALNLNGDVVYQTPIEGPPVQVRLADATVLDLPADVTRGVGISDDRLVLTDLASGGSGLCHVLTGQIEPISIPGPASAFAVAINSHADVAGSVGPQGFILRRSTGALTLVAPTLPSRLAGATSHIVQFNALNDRCEAVGVQEWRNDADQLAQPLWFDGVTLQALGQPDYIADGLLITNDRRMRLWRESSGEAIYEAEGHDLTPFPGTILDMRSDGRVLWRRILEDGPGYLTTGEGVSAVIDLFPPGSGFSFAVGLRINDAGIIVGYGTIDDASHGFLLKPDV